MRRYLVVAVALLALSGCSGGAAASSDGPAFSGPDAMQTKVSSVLPLSECTTPARDIDGVMFTQCSDATGGLVRLSTVDVGQEAATVEALTASGWKTSSGPGWVAGVNSDQATLDKVTSALS